MYRTPLVVPPPRPPRSPLTYVLVGCAVMGTFAGIFGACGYWVLRKKTQERPDVHATTSAGVPASNAPHLTVDVPPVPVDGTPVAEAPPGPDDASMPPGTPASSLRARPPWGKMDHVRTGSQTVNEYAPQLEKPLELFMAAHTVGSEPLEHALVVCRVQTFAKADTFAGDDLHVRLSLGATPLVANDGPEDANLAFVSAPLASLKKGELVRLEVYDRDVFSLQPITKPQMTWNGGPINILDSGATIECRALTGDALGKLALTHAAAADQAIARLRQTKLDGHAPGWGYPLGEILVTERAIGDVAGLVGWDDPRTKRRVASRSLAIAAVDMQKPAVFAALHGAAKDDTAVQGIAVSKKSVTCGPSNLGCSIKVTVKNDTSAELDLHYGIQLWVATPKKGPQNVAISPASASTPLPPLAAGASEEHTIPVPGDLDVEHGPAVLGVCKGVRCEVLKLR